MEEFVVTRSVVVVRRAKVGNFQRSLNYLSLRTQGSAVGGFPFLYNASEISCQAVIDNEQDIAWVFTLSRHWRFHTIAFQDPFLVSWLRRNQKLTNYFLGSSTRYMHAPSCWGFDHRCSFLGRPVYCVTDHRCDNCHLTQGRVVDG